MLPLQLRTKQLWAVSGKDKAPYDPLILRHGRKVYFSTKKNNTVYHKNHLVDFDTASKLAASEPNFYPALSIPEGGCGYTIIDIEPNGVTQSNQFYRNLPYVYVEYSRNGGIHGVLDFDILDYARHHNLDNLTRKMNVKDPEYNTEVVFQRHFMTFTGKEFTLPTRLPTPLNALVNRLDKLAKPVEKVYDHIHPQSRISSIIEKPLVHDLQIRCYYLGQYIHKLDTRGLSDISLAENHWLSAAAGIAARDPVIRKYLQKYDTKNDQLTAFLPIVNQLGKLKIPFREKHYKALNVSYLGQVDYWQLTVYTVAENILVEELWT